MAKHSILHIGSRVYCGLHGGHNGIVYFIHGEQRPETVKSLCGVMITGGHADFDIVFDNGHRSLRVPEGIVRGVQWRILDEEPLASAEEIAEAIRFADATDILDKTEEQLTKDRRETERQRLRQEFGSWLTQTKPGQYGSAAQGAKNLKKELARAFPGVKFSVKSSTYSGGDSITVSWNLGPTTKQVEAISGKYQEGSFDGMQDMYETNHDNVWPDVFGGAKYVSENRHFPEELQERIERALCELCGVAHTGPYTRLWETSNRDARQETWQLLAHTVFAEGAEFASVEFVEYKEGMEDHHWVRVVFAGETDSDTTNENTECVPQIETSAALLETTTKKAPKLHRLRTIIQRLDALISSAENAETDYDERVTHLTHRRQNLETLLFKLEEEAVTVAKFWEKEALKSNFAPVAPETPSNVIPMPPQESAAEKLASARSRLDAL